MMNKLRIAFKHFKTITKHKLLVTYSCFRAGLIIQGLKHDLSKYSRLEFWTSVKYYTGTKSPISAEKADKGYSMMWLNHKARNRHHWEYWTDFKFGEPYAAKMPKRYLVEHVLDGICAGMVYGGKNFKGGDPLKFVKNEPYRLYHEDTKRDVYLLLEVFSKIPTREFYKFVKKYLKSDSDTYSSIIQE